MKLESYSITDIFPCLALPKMNDMDMAELSLWDAWFMWVPTHMCVRVRDLIKNLTIQHFTETDSTKDYPRSG